MKEAILRKARESADIKMSFIEANVGRLEACVRAMAARFQEGGRLLTFGNGGSASDAAHTAVEFIHPIIEKRRALPALALTTDGATLTALGNDIDFSRVFTQQLEMFAQPKDIALGFSTSGASANVNRALKRGKEMGLLTLGFAGRDGGRMADACEFCFVVPTWSIHRVQETHTLLLHLIWDQVHVALGEPDVI